MEVGELVDDEAEEGADPGANEGVDAEGGRAGQVARAEYAAVQHRGILKMSESKT